MANITLKDLRHAVVRRLTHRYFRGKTTNDTSAHSTSVFDAVEAARFPDGYFTGQWAYFPATGKVYYIEDFTSDGDSGSFQVTSNIASADVNNQVFEVYTDDPTHFVEYINAAANKLYPSVSRQIVLDAFTVGSPIVDPAFRAWDTSVTAQLTAESSLSPTSSTPLWWTEADATISLVATGSPLDGGSFLRLDPDAARQTITLRSNDKQLPFLRVLSGETPTFQLLVKAPANGEVKAEVVSRDSSGNETVTSSAAGDTSGYWQVMTLALEGAVPAANDVQRVQVKFDNDGSAFGSNDRCDIAYIAMYNIGGRSREVLVPGAVFPRGPSAAYFARRRDSIAAPDWRIASIETLIQDGRGGVYEGQPNVLRLQLGQNIPNGSMVRLVGNAPLTKLLSDADETGEIDSVALDLVSVEVAIDLLASGRFSDDTSQQRLAFLQAERTRLQGLISEPLNPVQIPRDI